MINSIENTQDVIKFITVNLKFEKNETTGKVIGFVTHRPSQWRGCRSSDNVKKQIVLIGAQMKETIIPGVLYRTKIRRASNCGNFIATSAKPVQFEGTINTEFDEGDKPNLVLAFGGKKIIYSPASSDPMYSSLDRIMTVITHRYDILDLEDVAQRFYSMALTLRQTFSEYLKPQQQ